jgi:hypothetical protein
MLKDNDLEKPWGPEPARTEMSSVLGIMKRSYLGMATAGKITDELRMILTHGRRRV